jgi:hypothetical protein
MIHDGNGVVEFSFAKQDYHALHHYRFFYLFQLAETKVTDSIIKQICVTALKKGNDWLQGITLEYLLTFTKVD